MMHLEFVGWFSDLPHGRPDQAKLSASTDKLSPNDAVQLAAYLEGGTVIAETTGEVLVDQLDPERPQIGSFMTVTDGSFIWPSDYPYYVRRYHVVAPAALIERARMRAPHKLNDSEIDAIIDALPE